jgi:signal transduction histidine kinase
MKIYPYIKIRSVGVLGPLRRTNYPMITSLERNLLVTNRIAMILGVLSLVLLIILVMAFGINVNSPLIFALSMFFFMIIFLNERGFVNIGRVLLCIVPAAITLTAAILAKKYDQGFTDILYYDSRFFLILIGIVPCLIFDSTEQFRLFGCLGVIMLFLFMFDPVHEFFGVGYFQMGFSGSSYYYINYVAAITFFGISAGSITLKRVIEKAELQNSRYRNDLIEINNKLGLALRDLEAQNQEILAQSEELHMSQEQLLAANQVIERQKAALQNEVRQVNSELQEANEELVKHNNELQQFSYTISHNLRGPIARILGLTNLAKLIRSFEKHDEANAILSHIETSSYELDSVTRELSAIADIRNTTYQIRQSIDFQKEWSEIKKVLKVSETMENRNFQVDFSAAPRMFSVRPMVYSILLNLVSNAIKYQSPDRELQVTVRTRSNNEYTVIQVSDNGLGIDLGLFQHDMFKMYKRFHHHQEGKGLGLYLIKSQAESLNGYVEVSSEPGEGSTFNVYIKNPTVGAEHENNDNIT